MSKIDFEELPSVIGIIGSRKFPSSKLPYVTHFVNELKPNTLVVSGGAQGVDKTAEEAALKRWDEGRGDFPKPEILLPDPKRPSPQRFFERNTEIVKRVMRGQDLKMGMIFAFLLINNNTQGTDNALSTARRMSVPYIVFRITAQGEWLESLCSPVFALGDRWQHIFIPSEEPCLDCSKGNYDNHYSEEVPY